MLVPAFPLLRLLPTARAGAAPWGAVVSSEALLFARGRFALFEGLRLLARERGLRRVWLPAYLCCPVVEATEALGLEPRFYDIDERLEPRLETIVPRGADALLVVHYFGLAQPMDAVVAFCRNSGMALIEDCAHILPDPEAPVRAGSYGDVAVFSLRKQAPVPSGGLLVVNDVRLQRAAQWPASDGTGDVRALLKLCLMGAERVAFELGLNIVPLKDRLPVLDVHDSTVRRAARISAYTTAPAPFRWIVPMLRGFAWDVAIRMRRDSWHRLSERLHSVPAVHIPVPVPPPGSVPHALPIWVSAPEATVRALRRRGVEAMRWPGTEQIPLNPDAYPGASAWLKRSVCLPLGVPLTRRMIDRQVHVMTEAAAFEAAAVNGALTG